MVKALEDIGLRMPMEIAMDVVIQGLTGLPSVNWDVVNQLRDGKSLSTNSRMFQTKLK